VQPRLRTLVWREMPPFVRRMYLAWSRRFYYFDLFLAQLYLSWTKSPTWNFVAFAGTLGILLTILLFLIPWQPERTSIGARTTSKRRPAWELDARLLSVSKPPPQDYPVEFLFDHRSRTQLADEPPPRRRRTPVVTEPDADWFTEQPQPVVSAKPPRFDWDIEVVTAPRRAVREPDVAEVSWTARTDSPRSSTRDEQGWDDLPADLWQPFDESRLARDRNSFRDEFNDHQTVGASVTGEPIGELWRPVAMPEGADSLVEVDLELSWNRATSRRRLSTGPQLFLRNLSSQPMTRIDVLAGYMPDIDAVASHYTQAVNEFPPGEELAVLWPVTAAQRGSSSSVISVLVTTFVGGMTEVGPLFTERPDVPKWEPAPDVVPVRPAPRNPDRPHLVLTIGKPGRLPQDQMVSVPMTVVNDGNLVLDEVAIVADVPEELEHRYGRKVHYRLGRMQPGETRQTTLLLTPLVAGTSRVPMQALDGRQLATDSGTVRIDVTETEIASVPREADAAREPQRRERGNTADQRR